MSFDAYLKYQPKVIKMLSNSLNKNRLAHAYLFEGEKGTKKKEIAIELAKMIYCESNEKPCDSCMNCLRIEHLNHPNVLLIEPDNNTIKKDQIINLQKEYSKTALEPGPKIYIINHIDKMSTHAANSILKFIEEPQPNTNTILITENLHQILPTIISRCQVLNFQPLPKEEIVDYLVNRNIELKTALITSQLTNDLDHALEISMDENIYDIIQLVISIKHALISGSDNPLVVCENSNIDIYTNKKNIQYFLDILLMYERDIEHLLNKKEEVTFVEELPFIKKYLKILKLNKIISNVNHILKTKINLDYNANTMLLIDTLLLNLK